MRSHGISSAFMALIRGRLDQDVPLRTTLFAQSSHKPRMALSSRQSTTVDPGVGLTLLAITLMVAVDASFTLTPHDPAWHVRLNSGPPGAATHAN